MPGNPDQQTRPAGCFRAAVCKGGLGRYQLGIDSGQWIRGSRPDRRFLHALRPGTFGWVDFTPPAGGASELGDHAVRGAVTAGRLQSAPASASPARYSSVLSGPGFALRHLQTAGDCRKPPTRRTTPAMPIPGPTMVRPRPACTPARTRLLAINAFVNDYLARRAGCRRSSIRPAQAGATITSTPPGCRPPLQLREYGRCGASSWRRSSIVPRFTAAPACRRSKDYACIFLVATVQHLRAHARLSR